MKIAKAIGNSSGVAVSPIDASATSRVGGVSVSSFAGLTISKKGKPFEMLPVTAANVQDVLGTAYHPTDAFDAEPMRHLADALSASDGYVVRVVPTDAQYPVIEVHSAAGGESKTKAAVQNAPAFRNTSHAYGVEPTLSPETYFVIYPSDGDPSINRSVSIGKPDAVTKDFIVTITNVDHLNAEYVEESHTVNFDPLATDDFGDSKYIVDVFAGQSNFEVVIGATASVDVDFSTLGAQKFVGGTNGTPANISDAQLKKAAQVVANFDGFYSAVLGMGFYTAEGAPTPSEMMQITDDRLIDGFFDLNPSLSYADALSVATASPINLSGVSLYHFPYLASDTYYSASKSRWGLSGMAYRAKVAGVNMGTGAVGGWHYAPAGEQRAVIVRNSVSIAPNAGVPDFEAMYKARINKVDRSSGGFVMIDDSLTTYAAENYLRLQHVNSTMNAISRDFIDLANQVKHQPDGITNDTLEYGMQVLFEGYVASGALVTPRNTADGESPFTYSITQTEIDLWEVQWSVCVTGTARRIVGRPALLR